MKELSSQTESEYELLILLLNGILIAPALQVSNLTKMQSTEFRKVIQKNETFES